MDNSEKKNDEISIIASEIISSAHGDILLKMRFLAIAMGNLKWVEMKNINNYACDGQNIYYDPRRLISDYKKDQSYIENLYLHIIFHMIFHHEMDYVEKQKEAWDLACDVSVWTVMMELQTWKDCSDADAERRLRLKILRKRCPQLSAQKLYRLFLLEPPGEEESSVLHRLFSTDTHEMWEKPENYEISLEQWRKITERIKADLKSFSKNVMAGESLDLELADATRQKTDYNAFLRQFMNHSEAMHINDEEFDYIYYNYGLTNYGNMPLIEPLEYKDVNRIREFVIVLDTSASCKGSVVKDFVQKTIEILRSEDSYFKKVNIHIIQCDNQIQSDTVITCEEDLDYFLKNGKLTGFGSTDFRPAFEYVEKLREDRELTELKGLIYFTDGYGVYPAKMPDYEVAFVFPEEDDHAPEVPVWAARVVL